MFQCLVAELNMTLTAEHQFEIEKMKKELNAMKAKYLAQKKKNQKPAESARDNLPTLPTVSPSSVSFSLVTQRPTTPLVPINK